MAVVTPEGIVGKVAAVYPLVAQVLLVTDPTFKVGVESQKGHVHGVLDCGTGKCTVEQIQNEERIDNGEWFFTSGEDRIFPKGFPVGTTVSVQPGQGMKDIKLNLSGAPGGAEEVLVVLQGVHQNIPSTPPVLQDSAKMLPPPADREGKTQVAVKPQTEADKVMQKYEELGKQQEHTYGAMGSGVPNFNLKPPLAQATVPGGSDDPTSETKSSSTAQNETGEPARPVAKAPVATPSILGARTGSSTPHSVPENPAIPQLKPPAPEIRPSPSVTMRANRPAPEVSPNTNGPVLPLGAPPEAADIDVSAAFSPMNETSHQIVGQPIQENWFSRFQVVALVLITLVAIIGKFYLPRLVPNTEWLELPLLLTIYFGLMRRSQISSLFFGAFVGLAEDSLSPANLPIGMYGITKTLVGYFAASVSMRFNVESSVIRLVLSFFFYFFHAFLYWIMRRALLGQIVPFDPQETFVHGALNALVAIPLFAILDRMKLAN